MIRAIVLVLLAFPAWAQVVGQQIVIGNVGSGATDSGNPVKVGGKYNSSAITLSDGQRGDLQLDASGFLKVNVAAGSTGNAAASATGSAVPASADYQGINVAGTLRGQTGVNPSGTVYAAQTDITSVAGTTAVTAAAGVLAVGIKDASGNNINSTSNALNVSVQNASLAVTQSGNWTVIPKTACGTTASDSGFIANIATTGTDVFSATTCVQALVVSNTTSTNSTFTVQDKSGTPNVLMTGVPLPANSAVSLDLGYIKFASGLTLKCGASSTCQAQAFGWQ